MFPEDTFGSITVTCVTVDRLMLAVVLVLPSAVLPDWGAIP